MISQCCRDGLGVFSHHFQVCRLPLYCIFFDCCFQFRLQFPLPWQTMDTMFRRGVVSLKPATKHLFKKTVVVIFFCCCCCCCYGGGAGCMEPRRGTMMQLHCFEVELAIYKWKIVDCMMQQQSSQKRCWIRQHGHSNS